MQAGGWWVACVDMKPSEQADASIVVEGDTWGAQETFVRAAVAEGLGGDPLDAVICVAGGWAGGSPRSKDFIKNAEAMWRQSVWPAAISAAVATHHLKEGGLCVLPGAAPAVAGTPGMAGYGMAKAAVHQLARSLAGEGSGLPAGACSLAILPVTLDTPMNRLLDLSALISVQEVDVEGGHEHLDLPGIPGRPAAGLEQGRGAARLGLPCHPSHQGQPDNTRDGLNNRWFIFSTYH